MKRKPVSRATPRRKSQRGPSAHVSTWIQVNGGKRNMAGPRIRRIRMLKKITQIELLGKLSRQHVVLTQVSIAKIEAGQRALFDYEVFAFARALSVPLSDLLS